MKVLSLEMDLGELGYHECAISYEKHEDGLCEVFKIEAYLDEQMMDLTPLAGAEELETLGITLSDVEMEVEPEYEPDEEL